MGDCGPHEQARQLERWARRAARADPFDVGLVGAGSFPAQAWRARVLWIGLGSGREDVVALAHHDQQPHLTVARTRGPADVTGLVDALASYDGPVWTVTELAVMTSYLRTRTERGPRYEVVETFPLGN